VCGVVCRVVSCVLCRVCGAVRLRCCAVCVSLPSARVFGAPRLAICDLGLRSWFLALELWQVFWGVFEAIRLSSQKRQHNNSNQHERTDVAGRTISLGKCINSIRPTLPQYQRAHSPLLHSERIILNSTRGEKKQNGSRRRSGAGARAAGARDGGGHERVGRHAAVVVGGAGWRRPREPGAPGARPVRSAAPPRGRGGRLRL
jgi:hypothetical protein